MKEKKPSSVGHQPSVRSQEDFASEEGDVGMPPRRAGEGSGSRAAHNYPNAREAHHNDLGASHRRKVKHALSDSDWDRLARGPRRWPKRAAVLLILLAALVAALPTVVSKLPPVRNAILSAVVPKDCGLAVAIGDLSLGWLNPPTISAIEVRDGAGRPLVGVESLALSRSPWQLATNWRELGEITVTRPVIYVAVRPDGSNIEDAIKGLTGGPGAAPGAEPAAGSGDENVNTPDIKPRVAVKCIDGTVLVQDLATGHGWRLQSLNAQFDSHGGGLGQLTASGEVMAEGGDGNGTSPIFPTDSGKLGQSPTRQGTVPGKFALSLGADAGGREQLQWQAESITLAAAEPWLRRFAPGAEINGSLTGQGTATWSANGNGLAAAGGGGTQIAMMPVPVLPVDLASAGSIRIDRLDVSGPQLKGDRLRLVTVEMPWRIASQAGRLAIDQLEIRSDAASVAARGVLDRSSITRGARGSMLLARLQNQLGSHGQLDLMCLAALTALDVLGQHDFEVCAESDIAKLAAMLPHAMNIREGTTITSGSVQLAIRNQPVDGGQTLTGQIRTEKLAGTSGGQPIAWDQPVNATFELRRENGSVRLNSLKCDSDFLKVTAAGTSEQVTGSAEFDLNKLSSQLGQFVDVSGMQLTGTGTAHLDCQLEAGNQFVASANSELSQLRVALGSGEPLSEPRLALKADAAGALDTATHQLARVASARLMIDADKDQLEAQLAEPVDCTAATPTWPLSIHVTGSIAHWLALARPWMATDPWQVDGDSQATADVRATGQVIDVANAKATITNLHVVGVGWNIAEPRVELSADLQWDAAARELASQSAQVTSSTIALATKDVHVKVGGAGVPQMTGVGAFRADVTRMAAWQVSASQPAPFAPQGMVTGNLRVVQQGNQIVGEVNATGQNLALAQWTAGSAASGGSGANTGRAAGYQMIWQDPQVTLRGGANYDAAADKLALQQLAVQSNTLQAAVDGQIERLTTLVDVTAAGTMTYDLAQVTPLLKPYVGEGVQLGGRETARFQIAGRMGGAPGVTIQNASFAGPSASAAAPPHWSRRLQARVEAPWDSANIYGLSVGGGKIAALLADGALRIDPFTLAVSDGQLNAAPNVQFDPRPMLLTLPKGPLLTNVRIAQEVSDAMLKFIAPVLAGATQSEGQFSLDLDRASVPLLDTKKTDAAGKLTVHSVRVVPGPMAKQWVDITEQIQSLLRRQDAASADGRQMTLVTMQDQQVNFRVADGRVYHQAINFQLGELPCTSEGSVGLDETVAITLRISIPDKWVENQPLLAGLKGQQLTIPISGTLARPQMDQRAVAGLSRQLVSSAAQQAVGGELNKALDKLFKAK
jgi:hypothetical protein